MTVVVGVGDCGRDRARGVPAGERKRSGFTGWAAVAVPFVVLSGDGVRLKKLAASSFSLFASFAAFTFMLE